MGRLWRPRSEHQNGGFLKWGYPQIINFYGIFLGLFQWIVDLYGGFLSHRATSIWGDLHLFSNPPVIRTATEDGNKTRSSHRDIPPLCNATKRSTKRFTLMQVSHAKNRWTYGQFSSLQTVKFPEANCRLIFETLPEMIFFAYSSHQLCQEKHWV